MNLEEIKQKVNGKEYDFLKTNKHLGANIILLTLGGSYSYGTNNENSDLDVRGVTLESKREVMGLSQFEQFDNSTTDTTIYGLRKYISLILNCNPNTIELMGTKDEHIFILTEAGKLLKDNINLFLSKKAINSFGGYATAQLRRLQNALARDSYPQNEKELHILKSLENEIEKLKEMYTPFSDEIKIYMDKSNKEDIEEEIFVDMNFKHYPLRDLKNIQSSMMQTVGEYEKLSHRNKKKDEIHLNKHSMHLIRLLLMGTEILEGKGVNTYREKDREFLLKIRNGDFVQKKNGKDDYSVIFEMVNEYEKKFKYAANNTVLQDKPDYCKVEDLLMGIYENGLMDEQKL